MLKSCYSKCGPRARAGAPVALISSVAELESAKAIPRISPDNSSVHRSLRKPGWEHVGVGVKCGGVKVMRETRGELGLGIYQESPLVIRHHSELRRYKMQPLSPVKH